MDSQPNEFNQILKTFSIFRDEKTLIYQLSQTWKVGVWFIILLSLTIGWLMKYFMFKHIARTGFRDQPINWMIFTEQFLNFILSSFVLVSFFISHTMSLSVGDFINHYFNEFITDRQYCLIFCNVNLLNHIYRGVNGCGMAFVRFLYVVKCDWVKFKFGQRIFFFLSWFSVLAISAAIMVLYCMQSVTKRPLYFICLGRDESFEVRPLKIINILNSLSVVCLSAYRPVCLSVSQSFSQPVSQPVSQLVSQ
jgi:hypothetical protein